MKLPSLALLALFATGAMLFSAAPEAHIDLTGKASLSGETLLFGTSDPSEPAYIYDRQPDGSWTLSQELIPVDGAEFEDFGDVIDLDGDIAVVGTPDAPSGGVHIFERQPDGSWLKTDDMTGTLDSRFGESISVSGDTMLVGAPYQEWQDTGATYVFQRQSDGSWSQVAELLSDAPAREELFGAQVSVSGGYAVVGNRPDSSSSAVPRVLVYERQADNDWEQVASLEEPPGVDLTDFPSRVSLAGDLLVAASTTPHTRLHLFERQPDGQWLFHDTIVEQTAEAEETLTGIYAFDGNSLIVAARDPEIDENKSNIAYIYTEQDGTWEQVDRVIRPSEFDSDAAFATWLSVSGDYAATPQDIFSLSDVSIEINRGDLLTEYTGEPQPVTVITSPPGLAYSVTYDGGETPPTDAGEYEVVATITEPGFAATDARTLTIEKAKPRLILHELPPLTVCSSAKSLTVAISNGLPIQLTSSNPSAALLEGRRLYPNGVGTTVITATAEGNENYLAPDPVEIIVGIEPCPPVYIANGIAATNPTTRTATAIAATNTHAFLGAPDSGTSGAVFVFEQLESGPYNQITALEPEVMSSGADFGITVEAEGELIVVGAPNSDANGEGSGEVVVFQRIGPRAWEQAATFSGSDTSEGDAFGTSIDLSGNLLIVGAPGAGDASGRAYVFFRGSDGSWNESAALASPNPAGGDNFGASVAINANADAALVAAPNSGAEGEVYAFVRESSETWTLDGPLFESLDEAYTDIGHSVALSAESAAVAAGSAVVIFDIATDGSWEVSQVLGSDAGELKKVTPPETFIAIAVEDTNTIHIYQENEEGLYAKHGQIQQSEEVVGFGKSITTQGSTTFIAGGNLFSNGSGRAFAISTSDAEPQAPSPFDDWLSGQGLTGLDAQPNADPDEDGFSNLMSYAFDIVPGTGATANGTNPMPVLTQTGFSGDDQPVGFQLTLPMNFPEGISYTVEISTDYASWQQVAVLEGGDDNTSVNADVTVTEEIVDGNRVIAIEMFGSLLSEDRVYARVRAALE